MITKHTVLADNILTMGDLTVMDYIFAKIRYVCNNAGINPNAVQVLRKLNLDSKFQDMIDTLDDAYNDVSNRN